MAPKKTKTNDTTDRNNKVVRSERPPTGTLSPVVRSWGAKPSAEESAPQGFQRNPHTGSAQPLPHGALRLIATHMRALDTNSNESEEALGGIRMLVIRVVARPVKGGTPPAPRGPANINTFQHSTISAPMSRAEIAKQYTFASPLLNAAGADGLRLIVLLQMGGQNYCAGFCRDAKRRNAATSSAAPPSGFKERHTAINRDVDRPLPEEKQ